MSKDNETFEIELSNWCQSYVERFSAYDAGGIEAHWSFPALIVHGDAQVVFKTGEHFTANTENLLSFYKKQGVARADRKLLSCASMGAGAAMITVEDRMLDSSGAEFVTWQASYVLRDTKDGWRAIFAVANGEGAAWIERGTPLGS